MSEKSRPLNRTHRAEVASAYNLVQLNRERLKAAEAELRGIVSVILRENNLDSTNQVNVEAMEIVPPRDKEFLIGIPEEPSNEAKAN